MTLWLTDQTNEPKRLYTFQRDSSHPPEVPAPYGYLGHSIKAEAVYLRGTKDALGGTTLKPAPEGRKEPTHPPILYIKLIRCGYFRPNCYKHLKFDFFPRCYCGLPPPLSSPYFPPPLVRVAKAAPPTQPPSLYHRPLPSQQMNRETSSIILVHTHTSFHADSPPIHPTSFFNLMIFLITLLGCYLIYHYTRLFRKKISYTNQPI